jgi:hypothetical protein
MIEGSGAGSGNRSPKNMWILLRIRIRIRNTAFLFAMLDPGSMMICTDLDLYLSVSRECKLYLLNSVQNPLNSQSYLSIHPFFYTVV